MSHAANRTPHAKPNKRWVWFQLAIGWAPLWALFTVLIMAAHNSTAWDAVGVALRLVVAAALLGPLVWRLARRVAWPTPLTVRFVLLHLSAAVVYAFAWVVLNGALESARRGHLSLTVGFGLASYVMLGVWIYVMTAGVAYSTQASERAATAEALAASAQLATLRSQLNPHFLFNALHTVVHLIPREPAKATRAVEQLAELLRRASDEQRDAITLREEWQFVERYLALESLRFGDRLRVIVDIPEPVAETLVPSFSLQTLVENAVRHGAAPRVQPTEIRVSAQLDGSETLVRVVVRDDGQGADLSRIEGVGTGLNRLRERLTRLFGSRARFSLESEPASGFTAMIELPRVLE